MKLRDLTGERFGKLTVISRAPDKVLPSGYKTVMWNCNCDCGGSSVVSSKNLLYVKYPTRSCGCEMHKIRNNLVGKKFGRLTVLEKVQGKILKSGYEEQTYKCECDCGNKIDVTYGSLTSGNTLSCGCLFKDNLIDRNTKHGMKGTKIYDVWKSMRRRCNVKTDKSYRYYGAKGIKVCDEWNEDFMTFYSWAINNGYKEGLSIDRIDVNGDYEPSNCRWTTQVVQMNNTTSNRVLEINGINKTLAEWCRTFDVDQDLVWSRLKLGWDTTSALIAPKGYQYKKKGKYENGEELFSRVIRC